MPGKRITNDFYYSNNRDFFALGIFVSCSLHIVLILLVYFFSIMHPHRHFNMGDVYTVNLVDMPSSGGQVPTPISPLKGQDTGKSPSKSDDRAVKISNSSKNPVKPDESFNPIIKTVPIAKPKFNIFKSLNPKSQPSNQNPAGSNNAPGGNYIGAIKGKNLTPGSAQMGNNPLGKSGVNSSTGGKPFPDPYYLLTIQQRITNNWNPPSQLLGKNKQMRLLVFFTVDRQGKIADIDIEETSGSTLLDQSAIRAVQLTNPLPPLPSVVKEDIIRVHFGFTYAL
jgi:colicin import membrane protein